MTTVAPQPLQRRAWRINEWRQEVPFSRAQIQEWIKDKTLDSVRIGGARLVLTSPADFIKRHLDNVPAAPQL
jgi:hypothetical protein